MIHKDAQTKNFHMTALKKKRNVVYLPKNDGETNVGLEKINNQKTHRTIRMFSNIVQVIIHLGITWLKR